MPREHLALGVNDRVFFPSEPPSARRAVVSSPQPRRLHPRDTGCPGTELGSHRSTPLRPHPPATLCSSAPGPALLAWNTAPSSLCVAGSLLEAGDRGLSAALHLWGSPTQQPWHYTWQRTWPQLKSSQQRKEGRNRERKKKRKELLFNALICEDLKKIGGGAWISKKLEQLSICV